MPLKPVVREEKSEPRDQNLSIRISKSTLALLNTLCRFSGKSTGAVIDEAIKTEYAQQQRIHPKELAAAESIERERKKNLSKKKGTK